jgi:hypothetical protein
VPEYESSHRNPDPANKESDTPESAKAGDEASLLRRKKYTRRGLLALGGVAGAGIIAAAIVSENQSVTASVPGSPSAPGTPAVPPPRTFVSSPLTVQKMTTVQTGETAPGFIFMEPQAKTFNGQIVANNGEPVWIGPNGVNMTDLKVQIFEGKPVLTFWSGKSLTGHGNGIGNILDSSYNLITQVQTGPGMQADLHEFHLTPQGTAFMTAYPTVAADLSSVGGPANGFILNCHVQEVDVRSGKVLFDWSTIDHVAVAETFASVANPADGSGKTVATAFDAFHLNAIDFDDDNLYISSRHTHTIYSVNRKTGAVNWRMGGKKSDFAIDKDAAFAWQHHIRKRPNGMFTVFNNNSRTAGAPVTSAGLLLNVDEQARTVRLQQTFTRNDILAIAEGSVQPLDNGNVLVGWGSNPAVTEFAANGEPVLKITDLGTGSYRAFRSSWVGTPTSAPDLAVKSGSGGKLQVYASWNGATEVRNWRILAGSSATSLKAVGIVPRSGFETTASIAKAAVVTVQALDGQGTVLGTSAPVSA